MMDKTRAQQEMFGNRLAKRQRHLRKWSKRVGAGAYLLYDRDIPEVPLRVEFYDTDQGAALCVSLYERPWKKDDGEEAAWLAAMKDAAGDALGIAGGSIFLRERRRLRSRDREDVQYKKNDGDAWRVIAEAGLHYRVNLSAYLDTGFFPDRRLFRALLRGEAAARSAGCRALNLFCYTGALSVSAASGGAQVDSVDISNTYLRWAQENFALNGIGGPHRFVRADVLRFVGDAANRREKWDFIVLDPPAFSNSKKMAGDFDLKRGHAPLVEQCLGLLNPGGALYFSASAKGFKLIAGFNAEELTERLRDEDFRGRRIPRTWIFR